MLVQFVFLATLASIKSSQGHLIRSSPFVAEIFIPVGLGQMPILLVVEVVGTVSYSYRAAEPVKSRTGSQSSKFEKQINKSRSW